MSRIRDPDAPSSPPSGAPQPQTLEAADPTAILIAELDRCHAENAQLRGALNDRRRQLDAILTSTSWRITEPLRTWVRRLRGMLRTGRDVSAAEDGHGRWIGSQVYAEWVTSFCSLSTAARMLLRRRIERL